MMKDLTPGFCRVLCDPGFCAAVIGGTASVRGGGKFENGAATGAFGYLYNHGLARIGQAALSFVQIGWSRLQGLVMQYGPSATTLTADLAGVNGTLNTSPTAVDSGIFRTK